MQSSLLTRASDGAVRAVNGSARCGSRSCRPRSPRACPGTSRTMCWVIRQPFFAPIAAAVSPVDQQRVTRATRHPDDVRCDAGDRDGHRGAWLPRSRRRGQIAVAALIALCIAVAIGSGLHRARDDVRQPDGRFVDPGAGPVPHQRRLRTHRRRADRRCLAIVFAVLLFPADPLKVLQQRAHRRARRPARDPVPCRGFRQRTQSSSHPTGRCRPSIGCTNSSAGSSRPAPPPVRSYASRRDDGGCAIPSAPPITRPCTWPCSPARCCNWPVPSLPLLDGCCARLPPPAHSRAGGARGRNGPRRLRPRRGVRLHRGRASSRFGAAVERPRENPGGARRRRPGMRRRPATGHRPTLTTRSRPGTPGPVSSAPGSATPR